MSLEDIGHIHQYLPCFEKRLEIAKQYIKEAFAISKKPYLACSGGKDSIAMLAIVNDVAKELNRDFTIWAHISDASYPGTVETLTTSANLTGRELILNESPVSAFSVVRDKITRFGKRGYFFDAIREYGQSRDLAFVGVRAKESKRREKAAKHLGHLFESSTAGHRTICYPIVWFSFEDVCATIVRYKLPFHPIYSIDKTVENLEEVRLGYVTAQDLMHRGTIVFLRKNYPEMYAKLIKAFPERSRFT